MIEQPSPTVEEIKQFVVAGHFDLDKITRMLASNPRLLNESYQWGENDTETAIQAAAHAGSRVNAQFLLGKGAPLEICTAAMLGMGEEVKQSIKSDPAKAKATGAHRIPLLAHTVFSENLDLIEYVFRSGATTGSNLALHNAVYKGNPEIVRWLLDNTNADINSKNFEGKTALRVAKERGNQALSALIADRGGIE